MKLTPTLTLVMTCLLSTAALAKDPATGATTFTEYEAYLSPQQEPADEANPPARDKNKARGYARLRFNKDLSRIFVDMELTGVAVSDLQTLHLACAAPGVVGPIVVDVGSLLGPSKLLASGKASFELTNKDVAFTTKVPKGMKPAVPEACGTEAVVNVAAVEALARKGLLYVNLTSKNAPFYGELRGQLYAP